MSELSTQQVAHVARLARLDLNNNEVEQYCQDLNAIVAYIEKLRQIDLTSTPATLGVQPHSNVLRQDEVLPSLGSQAVLLNAPQAEQDAFRIPRILEEA